MKFQTALLACSLWSTVFAVSTWSYTAAKIDISGVPYTIARDGSAITASLQSSEKLRLSMTVTLDNVPTRPHQAMLLVSDPDASLEASLVVPVGPGGRGQLSLTHAELAGMSSAPSRIDLTLVVGGFGETRPLMQSIASIALHDTPTGQQQQQPASLPLRYGRLPEITHTFRAAQRMPSSIISVFFSFVLVLGLAALFGAWSALDANVNAFSAAWKNAPTSYTVFLASLVALETAMGLYWAQWNIMTALGVLAVLAVPTFFAGRSALRETETRRIAGLR